MFISIYKKSVNFDKVPHKRLLTKFIGYSVHGKLLDWTEHFLLDRTQYVNIESGYSEDVLVTNGTAQGSVPGPALFV